MNYHSFFDRANGKWHGILSHLGIGSSFLTKKNGPCPMCGGKDRWRWTDFRGDGSWVCNNCGTGSGIDLVKLMFNKDFRESIRMAEEVIGKAEPERQLGRSEAKLRAAMREVWNMGRHVEIDCPVGLYLARRVPGLPMVPRSIRSTPLLRHGNEQFPAMLAQVIGLDGKAVNLMRTWITIDGHKAPVDPVRKLMPGSLPGGSAIRLGQPCSGRLGIAEGLETALSASVKFGMPVWSVISAGNMEKFCPPNDVDELWIFGDNDKSFVGQSAAYTVARECKKMKREITIKVMIPDADGSDWADG